MQVRKELMTNKLTKDDEVKLIIEETTKSGPIPTNINYKKKNVKIANDRLIRILSTDTEQFLATQLWTESKSYVEGFWLLLSHQYVSIQ